MSKLLKVQNRDRRLLFWCPGCDMAHEVHYGNDDPRWSWNYDLDRPTFSPSIVITFGDSPGRCHSFVTLGQIQYLNDCTHHLAGRAVDLPRFPK